MSKKSSSPMWRTLQRAAPAFVPACAEPAARMPLLHAKACATVFLATIVLSAAGSPDLLVAIRNGDHSQVQKLLRAGADVNTADTDGTTALMHATIESDVKMMKLLLESGANVN